MSIVVIGSVTTPLDWNATGEKAVLQRVQNLLSIRKGEVAYARDMGIDPDLIDKPSAGMIGLLTNEVNELINEYEPNAKLEYIELNKEGNYLISVGVKL